MFLIKKYCSCGRICAHNTTQCYFQAKDTLPKTVCCFLNELLLSLFQLKRNLNLSEFLRNCFYNTKAERAILRENSIVITLLSNKTLRLVCCTKWWPVKSCQMSIKVAQSAKNRPFWSHWSYDIHYFRVE